MADPDPTGPSEHDVEAIIADFERSDCRELHMKIEGFELYLSKDPDGGLAARTTRGEPGAPQRPREAPVRNAAASVRREAAMEGHAVIAPYLGTFYRAPKPGAAPYVELGQAVGPEDEVCLVEVMKLFTAVRAGAAGRIVQVLANDGEMVEAGQPLFVIAPGD